MPNRAGAVVHTRTKGKAENPVRKKTQAYATDQARNPIEDRPAQGRKAVKSKAGGVVAKRTAFTDPETPEVGFANVEPRKRKTNRG